MADMATLKSTLDDARAKVDAARKVVDAIAGAVESFPWVGGYAKLIHAAVDGIDDALDLIDDAAGGLAPKAP